MIGQAEHAFLSAIVDLPTKEILAKFAEKVEHLKESANAASAVTNQSVQNDISDWIFNLEQDADLIERTRQQWGFTDRDNVKILVVCANSRFQPMSFVTRPTRSPRSDELTIAISRRMSEISELEMGKGDPNMTDAERSRKINALEQNIRDSRRDLSRERARLRRGPRSGFVVVQRGM